MRLRRGSVMILVAVFAVAVLVGGIFVTQRFVSVVSKQAKTTQDFIDRDVTLNADASLKTAYSNPFDAKTQYSNPFSDYKNPIDQIQ